MSPLGYIYVQFVIGLAVMTVIYSQTLFRVLRRWSAEKALILLTALQIFRFGGLLAAAAPAPPGVPSAFLAQVAIGDGSTAVLAILALVALRRRGESALTLVLVMNIVGFLDILVSESWIGGLELAGTFSKETLVHIPSLGPMVMMPLHFLSFYFLNRARGSSRLFAVAS